MKHKYKTTLFIWNYFRSPQNIEYKSFTMASHIELLINTETVLGNSHFYLPGVTLAVT